MAPRAEGGGGLCWLCSRRACFVVGGAAVLSSFLYALYRYYRSGRDNDMSKDEGFVDTTKVCRLKPFFQPVVTHATQGVMAKFVVKKKQLAVCYAASAIVVSGLSQG